MIPAYPNPPPEDPKEVLIGCKTNAIPSAPPLLHPRNKSMLKWEKGNHPQDGIWWKHWYDNVITTTHFQTFSPSKSDLDLIVLIPENIQDAIERRNWIEKIKIHKR